MEKRIEKLKLTFTRDQAIEGIELARSALRCELEEVNERAALAHVISERVRAAEGGDGDLVLVTLADMLVEKTSNTGYVSEALRLLDHLDELLRGHLVENEA